MKMSYREQLNDNRPYWKVLVSLIFSLIATVLFVGIGIKLIVLFLPFVIGWFIAYLVSPIVNILEQKFNLIKKFGSAITIVFVLAAVVGILYGIGNQLFFELRDLIQRLPEMYEDFGVGFSNITEKVSVFTQLLPEGVRAGGSIVASDFNNTLSGIVEKISEPTVMAAGNFARRIPAILIGTIVTILSAYFFVAEREKLIVLCKKVTPEPILKRMSIVMYNLKYAIGGYFKAQFKIMLVIWVILVLGFMILGIDFNFILSLLIAFLDFLPFFGTGTAFVPWIIYEILTADYKMAIGLLILYPITQIVHHTIQPKLVGDCVGLHPIVTLVFIYLGYKVGSVLGMILAVPVGMIIINLFKAGAMDYILDDVKILLEGILSLREKE